MLIVMPINSEATVVLPFPISLKVVYRLQVVRVVLGKISNHKDHPRLDKIESCEYDGATNNRPTQHQLTTQQKSNKIMKAINNDNFGKASREINPSPIAQLDPKN